jgi:Sec-independent protein translocase protein TatA
MVIVAVVLLLLGPDKLPEVAHRLGSSWRALKRIQERVESEVRGAIPDLPSTGDIARIARSPVNLLNQLADRVDAKEAADPAAVGERTIEDAPEDSEPLITPHVQPTVRRIDSSAMPPDPSLN